MNLSHIHAPRSRRRHTARDAPDPVGRGRRPSPHSSRLRAHLEVAPAPWGCSSSTGSGAWLFERLAPLDVLHVPWTERHGPGRDDGRGFTTSPTPPRIWTEVYVGDGAGPALSFSPLSSHALATELEAAREEDESHGDADPSDLGRHRQALRIEDLRASD